MSQVGRAPDPSRAPVRAPHAAVIARLTARTGSVPLARGVLRRGGGVQIRSEAPSLASRRWLRSRSALPPPTMRW